MPLLAAALCSLLRQCLFPAGNGKEIAELQRNLANYVEANESVISSISEHDPDDLASEGYKLQIGDEMTPPTKPANATGLEQVPSSHDPYLSIHSSHNFSFKTPCNLFGEPTPLPGSLGTDIASVAEEVDLNVIINCMKRLRDITKRMMIQNVRSGSANDHLQTPR